jgi:hypothetical protein
VADPASLALQKALVARLRAEVASLAGRVYDRAPQEVAFPHVELGAIEIVDAAAAGDCVEPLEATVTLHVWSRATGAVECRRIAGAIRAALRGWTPDLTAEGWRAAPVEVGQLRDMEDPDGLTTHGVVTLTALIDAL